MTKYRLRGERWGKACALRGKRSSKKKWTKNIGRVGKMMGKERRDVQSGMQGVKGMHTHSLGRGKKGTLSKKERVELQKRREEIQGSHQVHNRKINRDSCDNNGGGKLERKTRSKKKKETGVLSRGKRTKKTL